MIIPYSDYCTMYDNVTTIKNGLLEIENKKGSIVDTRILDNIESAANNIAEIVEQRKRKEIKSEEKLQEVI